MKKRHFATRTDKWIQAFGCATAVVLLVGVASVAPAGEFRNLGAGRTPYGLSGNGSVITGYDSSQYFIWSQGGGYRGIGGSIPAGGVGGSPEISNDGSRICGAYLNPASGLNEMAMYNVAAATWTPLGGIGGASGTTMSSGWGISGNGRSVVGLGWYSVTDTHAIQWNEGGNLFDLGSTVANSSSRASSVNEDGSVVVGWQDSSDGFRQGAVWNNGVQSLLYMPNGTTPLGEANDVSANGEWVVGMGVFGNGFQPWRWSAATGGLSLGRIVPTFRGASTAISDDGGIIVGYDRPLGGAPTDGEGFIWTEETGMVNLTSYVASLGIDTQGFILSLPLAISADGTAIAGMGRHGAATVGWVVYIPEPASLGGLALIAAAAAAARRR
jgi:uncharacterized membrane protein